MSITITKKKTGVNKLYNSTQTQLYVICMLAWTYYLQYLDGFTAFSAAYTKEYGDDAIAAVNAAKAMKNIKARNQVTSENRNKTIAAGIQVCTNFQALKQYMKRAYKGADLVTNLGAAGIAYYAKACKNDWNYMVELITAANHFINEKKNELMKNNNMPGDFAKKFTEDAKACSELIETFLHSTITKKGETTTKQDANNAVYATLISMLESGQVAYKENKTVRDIFVFNALYQVAKSKSPASLKGYVVDNNGKPFQGATVSIQNTELQAVTDKKGYFSIGRVNAEMEDMYLVNITANDYVGQQEEITFKPGTSKHLKVTLQPLTMQADVHTDRAADDDGVIDMQTQAAKAV